MAVELTPELKEFLETSDLQVVKSFRQFYALHLAAPHDRGAYALAKVTLDEAVEALEKQRGRHEWPLTDTQ